MTSCVAWWRAFYINVVTLVDTDVRQTRRDLNNNGMSKDAVHCNNNIGGLTLFLILSGGEFLGLTKQNKISPTFIREQGPLQAWKMLQKYSKNVLACTK